jgi:hypothetical protein
MEGGKNEGWMEGGRLEEEMEGRGWGGWKVRGREGC